jgi:hypothetical protein
MLSKSQIACALCLFWKFVFVLVFLLGRTHPALAQETRSSTARLSADFAHFSSERKLSQDVQISSPVATSGSLGFECYRYVSPTDSLLVYGRKSSRLKLPTGVSSQSVTFGYNDSGSYVQPDFFQILKRYRLVPAGTYRWYGRFIPDSGDAISAVVSLLADSVLPPNSALAKELTGKLGQSQSGSGLWGTAKSTGLSVVSAAKALDQASSRIGRLMKASGLESRVVQHGAESQVQLWYQDWFVGSYRLEAGKAIGAQLQQQKAKAAGSVSSLASNGLESYRSLTSQVRELARGSKEEKEISGQVAVTGSWANGQPEYSAQDNNFYELRAGVAAEVADIPVSIEGYYTTQDAHREIKASYVHFQYDADRAKEKLLKLIEGYKRKYSETVAQSAGLGQVYGSYLSGLNTQKEALVAGLAREAGLPLAMDGAWNVDTAALRAQLESQLREKLADTAGMLDRAGGKLDSAGKVRAAAARAAQMKDSATKLYDAAMERYKQIKALEKQYTKYKGLLDQYRTTSYFDSALAYDKIRELKSGDATTYKQLSKSASGLLPEGKAKKLITGLTSFDAGIFPKYVSKYTMGGQQMKGLDLGYDIGFARIGLTAGQTEFAGRDGSLDKFSTYSGRVEFTPAKEQKMQLVYYGYTPSRKLLSGDDTFSKAMDLALPSFREPVHIVSAQYEGTLAGNIHVEGEGATSFRKGSGQTLANGFDADRIAWRMAAEGHIPTTSLDLSGSYEHGGKSFENSTMPMMVAGCDLMKAGIKGSFFRDFLSAGVEFNRMQQSNLYSTGGNNRWGFEIATHSKQYPSVSLSYKPFATFRTWNDTLTVQQRPVMGEVWTGRASYQIKRSGGVVYRFSAVLNRSTSKTDSLAYGADLLQLNASYTKKVFSIMLSGGQSALNNGQSGAPAADTLNAAHVRTTFLMASGAYTLKSGVSLSGGIDLGRADYGLSRWGLNAGISYRTARLPLSIRATGRYGAYRLPAYSGEIRYDQPDGTDGAAPMSWRKLVGGSLELGWTFKQKVNH